LHAGGGGEGLQGYLTSTEDRVICQAQTNAAFVCLLPDGTDLAQVALINGAARTKADAPEAYHEQEIAAQSARRGLWSNLPPPPVTVEHPVVQDTATLTSGGQVYLPDGVIGFGQPYAAQMQSYIAAHGDSLSCQPQNAAGRYVSVLSDGADIGKVALVNGAARVAAEAPDSYRV
jgi:endonuclease YncB( thermonuclease family)